MSRTLKRPMFRKGGEVMEGIMTGIKPRQNYATQGFVQDNQDIINNVRDRMNLIDVVAGGTSPLSDPLTQFLLTAGPDLVAGKAAGGTKLEEIIGGVRGGLQAATKTQQLKDMQNRKLATALLSKTGTGGLQKFKLIAKDLLASDKSYRDRYGTGPEAISKLAAALYERESYRQPISEQEKQERRITSEAQSIMKREQNRSQKASYYIESAALEIARAKDKLEKALKKDEGLAKAFEDGSINIDQNLYYVPPDVVLTSEGKNLVPDDTDRLQSNNIYYLKGTWYLFDGEKLKPKFKS